MDKIKQFSLSNEIKLANFKHAECSSIWLNNVYFILFTFYDIMGNYIKPYNWSQAFLQTMSIPWPLCVVVLVKYVTI